MLEKRIIDMESHLEWCRMLPTDWVVLASEFLKDVLPLRKVEEALQGLGRFKATNAGVIHHKGQALKDERCMRDCTSRVWET